MGSTFGSLKKKEKKKSNHPWLILCANKKKKTDKQTKIIKKDFAGIKTYSTILKLVYKCFLKDCYF